ncbi:MAG TPA: preprotein translocase subunit SecY [Acidiphilium sp.]|nr:MAG: preprotein translocase subunit SecY [Acidiphilium sp. 21-60-14]OYV91830.1 MAG: preprotein translocase subunit SecY [Acidiphilium sp. 37-60-79]OZB41268.1 MAG: preprotein translocase subunit SecY [Acidiphilium sp. 34-60-192]HQT88068.1 preprotein translocase subunit SecY [Acidiphilium sp.]HQU23016.1 preprotein translocase subunit SecY [Acidiphilium sp.]
MASAAEQLASSMNLGSFAKATELKQRIWFTLGALVVFRLGTYIPVPGVDATVMTHLMAQNGGGVLGMFNMFTGGALGRMTVFALNIMPYISASIIMQLMQAAVPSLETLKKEGQSGQQKINQYTRYLTVLIALVQSYGISIGLESLHSSVGPAVVDPGPFFIFTTVITLVGGTVFLMWLGEQITARGIGNGSSLIIFSGIVAALPGAVAGILQLGATGALSTVFVIGFFVVSLLVIAFVVFMERAQRRVLVQYPKRQVGSRMFGGDSSHLPMKVNTSGVIPPIFASSLLLIPATIIGFSKGTGPGWLQFLARQLSHGQPGYMILYAALIIFFSYFYTAVVFNPEETADNLKKYGGFVPGIRPGANTAKYFDTVLTRLTTIGAIYLCIVCLIPEFLIGEYDIPFYFGGTSLLIIVSVTMDTVAQVQSHLLAHQYEGLIRKGRGRTRGR